MTQQTTICLADQKVDYFLNGLRPDMVITHLILKGKQFKHTFLGPVNSIALTKTLGLTSNLLFGAATSKMSSITTSISPVGMD